LQLNAANGTMLLLEARGRQAASLIEGVERLIAEEPER
jgi:phosphotransferase system HPr-like phosphotransfer protein